MKRIRSKVAVQNRFDKRAQSSSVAVIAVGLALIVVVGTLGAGLSSSTGSSQSPAPDPMGVSESSSPHIASDRQFSHSEPAPMARRNGTLLLNLDTISPGDPLRIVFTATDGRVTLHGGGTIAVVEIHQRTRNGWVTVKDQGLVLDIGTTLSPGDSIVNTWDVPTNTTPGEYRAVYHTVGPDYTERFTVCTVSDLRDRYDDDLLERDGVWGVSGDRELVIHVESAHVADRVYATLPEPVVDCPVPVRFDISEQIIPEPDEPDSNESESNESEIGDSLVLEPDEPESNETESNESVVNTGQ
ncbi:hypothetical protein E6P09_14815 [Haloferax mediterranei ATCC 33500]|nr:hypothetical protein [Haloferax mediterranei]MDX5987169.1 hypothetical protein [Haloferax mediterranei ATCC 33500]QCQ76475.1 hypothetical protein E6P09_14815 [Haloferax mediterranei ATCC 33500]